MTPDSTTVDFLSSKIFAGYLHRKLHVLTYIFAVDFTVHHTFYEIRSRIAVFVNRCIYLMR
jgi:hypothetical protein